MSDRSKQVDPKRLANHIPADVDCRYQHTSEELKAVASLLDVLNGIHNDLSHDYGCEGTLDVFWADTIAGCIAFDSIYGGWVYLPTAKGEKPEVTDA